MTQKIRTLLSAIDDVLVQGDEEAIELWNILSALRGPDALNSSVVKKATTSVLRYTAFPKIGTLSNELGGPIYASMVPDSKRAATVRGLYMSGYGHFERHVKDAFLALGLKWNETN